MQCLSKQRAAQTRPAARVERRIVGCTAGRTSHTPCRDLKPETLSLEHCRTPSAQNPDAAEGGCHVHQFAACVGSPRTQDCRSGQACNLLLLLLLLLRLQLYLRLHWNGYCNRNCNCTCCCCCSRSLLRPLLPLLLLLMLLLLLALPLQLPLLLLLPLPLRLPLLLLPLLLLPYNSSAIPGPSRSNRKRAFRDP